MKYKRIYSIEVLNDYFPNGKGGAYRFVPTESCKQLLRQTGAFFKVWGNILYVIIKIDKDGKPARTIPVNSVFEFYIEPVDSAFFLYTVTSIKNSGRYLFHNAGPAIAGGLKHLYGLPAAFDNTKTYSLSDMVQGPGNNVFEALKNMGAGSSLNDGLTWANRGQTAYATGQSLITCFGSFAQLPVTPAGKTVKVEILKVHPDNVVPAIQVSEETVFFSEPVSMHSINCEKLTPGIYEIRVNNVPHTAYIDPGQTWQSFPALTAVGHYSHLAANLTLTDTNGVLLSPEYSIRFAPKSVLWQLKYRGGQLPANSDSSGSPEDISFSRPGPQPNIFLSSLPVRMQHSAYKNGILLLNNNDPPDQLKINHLPAPATTGLEIFRLHDTDYFLTTTNLYS